MNNLNVVAKKVPYEKAIAELGKEYNAIFEAGKYIDLDVNAVALKIAEIKGKEVYAKATGKVKDAFAELELGNILPLKNALFAIPAGLCKEIYKDLRMVCLLSEVNPALDAKVA